MPTYDYVCENCEHEFEKLQSITAKPLRKCPRCGKFRLRRLIGSGAGIIFKGTGFYETDYRSEGYKKAQQNEKADSKPEDTKTDTTPERKSTEKKPDEKKQSGKKDKKKTA